MVPDLFTGTLTHVLPLPVVPGRNGLQPDVQLRYGSANGSGSIGVGWELNFGDIERRTKGGLNYGADDYVLRANGAAVDLVNINGGQYRAKFESDFRRIRNRERCHLVDRLDQVHPGFALPERALRLRVPAMADHHDVEPIGAHLGDLDVNLRHQRADRVHDEAVVRPRRGNDLGRGPELW